MDKIIVKGVVDTITYRNKDNGYTVIKIAQNSESLVATGTMPFLSEGDMVELHGNYVFHSVYGNQFKCDYCEVSAPQTQTQILKYLSSGAIKGIGPATAAKIVELFKEESLAVIENEPHRLTYIKGISEEKAHSISEQYKMQFGIRDIMMTLSKYNIKPNEAANIFKILGNKSIELIKENPYILCNDVAGFSFERVDDIAVQFDIESDNMFRIASGIEYVLKSNLGNGHTCLPLHKLSMVASKLLEVDAQKIDETISLSSNNLS